MFLEHKTPEKPVFYCNHSPKPIPLPYERAAAMFGENVNKEDLPLISLPRNLLALDIDGRPKGLSWHDFKILLETQCEQLFEPQSWLVDYTPSGHLKIFISANFPENVQKWTLPRVKQVVENIQLNLPFPLEKYVDYSPASICRCYVKSLEQMLKITNLVWARIKWMSWDIHKEIYRDRYSLWSIATKPKESTKPYRYSGKAHVSKKYLKRINKKAKSNFKKCIKILLSEGRLASAEGFSISTHKVAATLGVSIPTASRYLRWACERKIITCICSKTAAGVKAKTYRLVDKFALAQVKTITRAQKTKPSEINLAGEFNKFLLIAVREYTRFDDVIEWLGGLGAFKVLPSKARERHNQARRTFKWAQKLC